MKLGQLYTQRIIPEDKSFVVFTKRRQTTALDKEVMHVLAIDRRVVQIALL